jgi:hypothetical protein
MQELLVIAALALVVTLALLWQGRSRARRWQAAMDAYALRDLARFAERPMSPNAVRGQGSNNVRSLQDSGTF